MTQDPVTGYMRPIGRDGFTAEDRATFVERFRVCSNIAQICKSVDITRMTFYDALVVDKKFRDDVNACFEIPDRAFQLEKGLEGIKYVEKKTVVNALTKAAQKYL